MLDIIGGDVNNSMFLWGGMKESWIAMNQGFHGNEEVKAFLKKACELSSKWEWWLEGSQDVSSLKLCAKDTGFSQHFNAVI